MKHLAMESANNFHKKIAYWDSLIRSGRGVLARTELSQQIEREGFPPREVAWMVASLARRLGLIYLALRVMRPIVRPPRPIHPEATPQELAVYAGALAKAGAHSEALDILNAIPDGVVAEVFFHKTTVHFQRWEYAKAIPILKKYLKLSSLSDYELLVGKVNLAAALVSERKYEASQSLLQEILSESERGNYKLIYANALELLAQKK